MTVVGIAVDITCEKGLELFSGNMKAAEEQFSTYLLSIDDELNKEQADILSSTAFKFLKEAGRMGIQWGASKGVNAAMKQWRGKEPQLEAESSKFASRAID